MLKLGGTSAWSVGTVEIVPQRVTSRWFTPLPGRSASVPLDSDIYAFAGMIDSYNGKKWERNYSLKKNQIGKTDV